MVFKDYICNGVQRLYLQWCSKIIFAMVFEDNIWNVVHRLYLQYTYNCSYKMKVFKIIMAKKIITYNFYDTFFSR